MKSKASKGDKARMTQEFCIDLPGEAVKCWRSSDHVKVILRKHRDVFFDINLKPGATYLIESTSDFYSVREKKLVRQSIFVDGERFHLWIGRHFDGKLLLKAEGLLIGAYEPNRLDPTEYDLKPNTKPEPLMVVFGKNANSSSFSCDIHDPYDVSVMQSTLQPLFDTKFSILKSHGSEFDYEYLTRPPLINEYVVVAEAMAADIRINVLQLLDAGQSVVGTITEIFNRPLGRDDASGIYGAILRSLSNVSPKDITTANSFKETLGYLQENWKMLDKALMTVRIEKRAIGKYRVIFKGRPLGRPLSQIFGASQARTMTKSYPLGSHSSAFIDGGFGKTGRGGYGGVKRLLLTTAENFRGGVNIQIVGTIIDLCCDTYDVYGSENGSKDLTEFLGRAGVSLIKAGATAVIGSLFAAAITMLLTTVFVSGAPVLLVSIAVIAGFIFAAHIVDSLDDKLHIKENVAGWAR